MPNSRIIDRIISGMPTNDGAGVSLTRIIGQPSLSDLDPFLLLDEFRSDDASDYIGGFPEHPHRGFETVTYMLAGRMRHGDNQGNTGLLRPGSVQWMTAGRGILHSEMPEQEDGLMWGFQLWVNLPAKDKMTEPRYQDVQPEAIKDVVRPDGVRVKVIAGDVGGVAGAVSAVTTDPTYLDITLPVGTNFEQQLSSEYTAFLYVFEGAAAIGDASADDPVVRGQLAVLSKGETVTISNHGTVEARLLLVAGRPLHEPIARHGPFVMNTDAEIRKAVDDFRAGLF